jgi:hypothetical protein
MQKLSEHLTSYGIHFPTNEHQILCLPHILNTCSKHITEKYCEMEFFAVADEDWISDLGELINKTTYLEMLSQDPINHAQQVVKFICVSNLCQELFKATIHNGNRMKLWVNDDGEHVDILLQLMLRDVKSHWDIIYTIHSASVTFSSLSNSAHNHHWKHHQCLRPSIVSALSLSRGVVMSFTMVTTGSRMPFLSPTRHYVRPSSLAALSSMPSTLR